MFVPRLYTPGNPTWIFRSGLSLWQQSLTGMLIAYLSCAVSGSWASLSGLTLAAHKAFLTLILDDFEYDLAATALRTMRNGSSGIVPLGGGRRGYLLFIVEAFSVDPDLRVRRFRRSSGRPAGLVTTSSEISTSLMFG